MSRNGTWIPNHFAPLLESCHVKETKVLDLDSEEEFPSLRAVSPRPQSEESYIAVDEDSLQSKKYIEIDESSPQNVQVDPGADLEGFEDSSSQNVQVEPDEDSDSEDRGNGSMMNITSYSDVSHPYKNPEHNSLPGKFMSLEKQIDILKSHEDSVENIASEIPNGVKENVFILLHDSLNAKRRSEGKSSIYPDDCGSWQQGKNVTKAEFFLKTQTGYQSVKKDKTGTYFRLLKGKKMPLSPQPHEEQVITVKRKYSTYSTLAREQRFRKRVTWFESDPFPEIAFAEYIGPYPTQNPSIHGNSKSNKPYQRLSVRQKEVIASSLDKNQAPREIKDEIHAHIPEEPITLKTARNARYNYLKQKNPQDKQNLADDMITVLNKLFEKY